MTKGQLVVLFKPVNIAVICSMVPSLTIDCPLNIIAPSPSLRYLYTLGSFRLALAWDNESIPMIKIFGGSPGFLCAVLLNKCSC